MPSLAQTLPTNDIGFLRIVASLWGLELASSDPTEAAVELSESLCDVELLEEVVSTLPAEGHAALEALVTEGGRMAWVVFARRFGDLREMGAGRRDREQPQQHPNSAAEILYYRALLAKAFFDTPSGPQEFAFVPDDLRQALEFIGFTSEEKAPEIVETTAVPEPSQNPETVESAPMGRPASPSEKAHVLPATDHILDAATTLLAAFRLGMEPPALAVPTPVLTALLLASRLITPSSPEGRGRGEGWRLVPEAVKTFLESPRDQALAALVQAWQASDSFNELRQLPGLAFEGGWENQPLVTREFLLNLLEPIPEATWWSIPAFVRAVKEKYPDFQRPAGDYDSWFIKRLSDGQYLRGFAHWDEVDGALIRYFFQLLHWLGQVDLATAEEGGAATSFRLSSLEQKEERGKIAVGSNSRISVERFAPRAVRYQIARFTDWEASPNPDEYRYQVTTNSLKHAAEQGLKVSHLLSLLAKHAGGQVPPVFVKALQRWEANGTEAKVETLTVLKVSRPEVLEELRKSKAGRFLGEIIGPTTVVLQSGAESKIMAALAEMGLLADSSKTSEVS